MNAQNYTQKSLEAIQAAQKLTIENQNQQIEQIHLLAALLKQENGLVPQLLKKMGISVESLDAAVTAEVNKLPRVTGSGREADRFYVSRQVDEALTKSEELAKGMKDDFVSVEHLLLALTRDEGYAAARVLLTPGNYGVDFLREQGLDAAGAPVAKCSNFIGDALDEAAALGFADVLLVGHIGKLAKLAGGVMNTHSRYADCRTELLCAHAAVCGASQKTCAALLDAATTDACIALLDEAGLRAPVLDSLLRAVERHLVRRAAGAYRVGAVLFSNEYGLLGRTASAAEMLAEWKGKKQ